jgi:hypothetical protein
MMRSGLFTGVLRFGLALAVSGSLAACSDDLPATQPGVAGTGTVAAGAAANSGMPVAGTGAPAGAAGIGTIPSGVGAAGTGTPPTAAAGTGAAQAGAAGMAIAGTGAAGMAAPMFTPGSPTFSAIFEEIIVRTGCNGGPTCHASTAAGQLKMANKADSYTALVGVKAMGVNLVMTTSPNCKDTLMRVVAGDPNTSLLLKKITSTMPECGGKMPPSGAMLAPDKVEQIRAWIMAGAKND